MSDVEVDRSTPFSQGPIYAVLYGIYLTALTVLAILAANPFYFIVIAIAGFQVNGVYRFKKQQKQVEQIQQQQNHKQEVADFLEKSMTNSQGLPVIDLNLTNPDYRPDIINTRTK